jgi:hypothetical protein
MFQPPPTVGSQHRTFAEGRVGEDRAEEGNGMGMIEATRTAEPVRREPQRWDLWHLSLAIVLSLIIGGALTQIWQSAADTVPGCDSAQHTAAVVSLATARAQVGTLQLRESRPAMQALRAAEAEFLAMCVPARDLGGD